jgi:hypothetical protein
MPIGSSRRRRGCAIWKAWAEAGVRSSSFVMRHPLAKDSAQVTLVDGNDIVQAFSSNRSNQPLAVSVGGWRLHRSAQNLQPKRLQVFITLGREDRVTIMDEKATPMITGNIGKRVARNWRKGTIWHIECSALRTPSGFEQLTKVSEFASTDQISLLQNICAPRLYRHL